MLRRLRRIRIFVANVTIFAGSRDRTCAVCALFAKTLILQVYRPVFPRRRLTSYSLRNRLIFARYIFILPFLFISLRSAPNRGTNRNASKREGSEKNFAESTAAGRGQWGHRGGGEG